MKATSLLALTMFLGACGNKSAPTPAAAPVPAPAPAPVAAPEPVPEAEPQGSVAERPKESNADFTAAITFADGTSKKGKVVRVERSEDWFAAKGWTDNVHKLTVTLEGGDTEIEKPWNELRSVAISYGGKTDVNCSFDSSFTPAMYECVLNTTTTVTVDDGKSWSGIVRHKWKFVFDDGETEEFWIHKLPERRQEKEVPGLGTTEQNTELQIELINALMKKRSGHVPTQITIVPPS